MAQFFMLAARGGGLVRCSDFGGRAALDSPLKVRMFEEGGKQVVVYAPDHVLDEDLGRLVQEELARGTQ